MTYVWIAVGAFVGFIAGLAAAGICVLWLPVDYFERERRPYWDVGQCSPALRWSLVVARNLVGGALLIAGIAMLLLPGPGLLTTLLGLVLVDLPGKHALIRRILAREHVLAAANRLRARFHKPPLRHTPD